MSSSSRLSKTHPYKSKLLRSGLAEARSKGACVSTVLLSVCEVLRREGYRNNHGGTRSLVCCSLSFTRKVLQVERPRAHEVVRKMSRV